jgi:hypothetical protein
MDNITKLLINALTSDIDVTKKTIERLKDKVYKMQTELNLLKLKTNTNDENNQEPGQA